MRRARIKYATICAITIPTVYSLSEFLRSATGDFCSITRHSRASRGNSIFKISRETLYQYIRAKA